MLSTERRSPLPQGLTAFRERLRVVDLHPGPAETVRRTGHLATIATGDLPEEATGRDLTYHSLEDFRRDARLFGLRLGKDVGLLAIGNPVPKDEIALM